MIIKSKLKLALSAMLLTVGVSAYAADDEVILNDGSENGKPISWTEFVKAINNPSSITGSVSQADQDAYDKAKENAKNAQDAYDEAKSEYETASQNYTLWNGQLNKLAASSEKLPIDWLANSYNNAKDFAAAYAVMLKDKNYNDNTVPVWYYINEDGREEILVLSFTEVSGYSKIDGETAFYNTFKGKTYLGLEVYLGEKYNSTGLLTVSSFVNADAKGAPSLAFAALDDLVYNKGYNKNQSEMDRLSDLMKQYDTVGEDGKTELERLKADQDAKEAANKKAAEDLVAAKADYDEAVANASADALEPYKDVKLNADITTSTTLSKFDGTLDGNGHVITLNGASAVFQAFSGSLENVAINGKFGTFSTSATFASVANWNSDTAEGIYHDAGHQRTTYQDVAALGFAARADFGVDFANNVLAYKTDDSKVYRITIYDGSADATPIYVHAKDGSFYTGEINADNVAALTITPNTFVKSATTDLKGKGYTNLFFEDGTCDKVVITDQTAFFCPVELKASEVEYGRQFKAGESVICMPFKLESRFFPESAEICRYDQESESTFWFKKIASKEVPANIPAFIVGAAEGFSLKDLKNVTIAATPDSQKVTDEGGEDPSKAIGVFNTFSAQELADNAKESYRIYYLSNTSNQFVPAKDAATFKAFRMVIDSSIARVNLEAPRKIGIVDEWGIDITDQFFYTDNINSAVEEIEANVNGLTIEGGLGEIIFTSDVDFGKVAVYSLDGKIAAMANVVAGTTSVSVRNGLYIVNGQKVLVK